MSTTRTYMTQHPGGDVEVHRYLPTEAIEVFGAKAVELMRQGHKAIVHFPRCPNVLAIDLETAGLTRLGLPLDTKVRS